MDIKISVITLLKDAEEFLDRYFDSINQQGIDEIELLMVVAKHNSDNTYNLLKDRAQSDKRIVFVDEPEGESFERILRPLAFNIAKGEYVINLDIDDTFAPNYLKKLYDLAKDNDLDFSLATHREINADTLEKKTPRYIAPTDFIVKSKKDRVHLFKQHRNHSLRLARKSYLIEHNYHYDKGELYLHALCFLQDAKVGYCRDAIFNYYVRASSESRGQAINLRKKHFYNYMELAKEISNLPMDKKIKHTFSLLTLRCYIMDAVLNKLAYPSLNFKKEVGLLKKASGYKFIYTLLYAFKLHKTDRNRLLVAAFGQYWLFFRYFKKKAQ